MNWQHGSISWGSLKLEDRNTAWKFEIHNVNLKLELPLSGPDAIGGTTDELLCHFEACSVPTSKDVTLVNQLVVLVSYLLISSIFHIGSCSFGSEKLF